MELDRELAIAIDGPAGAGKSTVAKIVADKLGYIYVDSGAMYRALTLKVLRQGIDPTSAEDVVEMVKDTKVDFQKVGNEERILLDGEDVTEKIRQDKVSNSVSLVAKISGVRQELVKLQRKLAQNWGVVMDGRDIGTVVLKDADVKIFLTASLQERAQRRYEQLTDSGEEVRLEELEEKIRQRDKLDRSREVGPLKQAEDAIKLDTTNLTVEEVVEEIIDICREV
jgi:cytidylate kinase